MAEKKRNPLVKAQIFKQTPKMIYEKDVKTEKKVFNIIPKELTFLHSEPVSERKVNPPRMLIYKDSSEEDEEISRSTPPNIQDKNILGTPGAPMKFRMEFEKKVLRPKKLVYNDKENDNEDSTKQETNNRFYHSTPKRSEKNYEDEDFYYEKFINMTTIIPRTIVPIIDDDCPSVYSTNRQLSIAGESSNSSQQGRGKSKNQGSRKKKFSKSAVLNNDDSTCNKENNAVQSGREKDLDGGESTSDSYKNRSVKNDRNKEELINLSKIGELTHFRI